MGEKVQRSEVEQYEIPSAVLVEAVNGGIHAVDIILQRLPRKLRIRKKSVVAEVVCANPDCVDGVSRGAAEEFGFVRVAVLGVGDKGWEFIACDVGEGRVDGREPARRDLVRAYGA